MKEANAINSSLLTLGTVISKLATGDKKQHVPYRDSKLTLLLRDSLGGGARTAIIATVSPRAAHHSETISTLQFAQCAKLVVHSVTPAATVLVVPPEPRTLLPPEPRPVLPPEPRALPFVPNSTHRAGPAGRLPLPPRALAPEFVYSEAALRSMAEEATERWMQQLSYGVGPLPAGHPSGGPAMATSGASTPSAPSAAANRLAVAREPEWRTPGARVPPPPALPPHETPSAHVTAAPPASGAGAVEAEVRASVRRALEHAALAAVADRTQEAAETAAAAGAARAIEERRRLASVEVRSAEMRADGMEVLCARLKEQLQVAERDARAAQAEAGERHAAAEEHSQRTADDLARSRARWRDAAESAATQRDAAEREAATARAEAASAAEVGAERTALALEEYTRQAEAWEVERRRLEEAAAQLRLEVQGCRERAERSEADARAASQQLEEANARAEAEAAGRLAAEVEAAASAAALGSGEAVLAALTAVLTAEVAASEGEGLCARREATRAALDCADARARLETSRSEAEEAQRAACHALAAAQRAAAQRDAESRSDREAVDREHRSLQAHIDALTAQLASADAQCRAQQQQLVCAATTGTPIGALAVAGTPSRGVGRSRQAPRVVARVCELGRAGVAVPEIDQTLAEEGFLTSTGSRWPARNDGRVVVRLLLNHGIAPVCGGDARLDEYVHEYAPRAAVVSGGGAIGQGGARALEYADDSAAPSVLQPITGGSNPLPLLSSAASPFSLGETSSVSSRASCSSRATDSSRASTDQEQQPPANVLEAVAELRKLASEARGRQAITSREPDAAAEAVVDAAAGAEAAGEAAEAAAGEVVTEKVTAAEQVEEAEVLEVALEHSTAAQDSASQSTIAAEESDLSTTEETQLSEQEAVSTQEEGAGVADSDVGAAPDAAGSSASVSTSRASSLEGVDHLVRSQEGATARSPSFELHEPSSSGESEAPPSSPEAAVTDGVGAAALPATSSSTPFRRLVKGATPAHDARRLTRQQTQPQPSEPPWDSLATAQTTVGRRIRLYWGGDHEWYSGRIVLVHPTSRKAFVKYDDHDERWHAMWEEEYEFLDQPSSSAV